MLADGFAGQLLTDEGIWTDFPVENSDTALSQDGSLGIANIYAVCYRITRIGNPRRLMIATSEGSPRRESAATSELLRALANEPRRQVVYYLRESHDVATIDELTSDLSTIMETDTDRFAAQLHHQILPKLIDAGLVALDRESNQVQYVGGSFESGLIDWLRNRNR